MSRILFYVPAVDAPSGGVNVIFEWVDVLRAAGFDICVFSDRPDYSYKFLSSPRETLFSAEIRAIRNRQKKRKARLRDAITGLPSRRASTIQPRSDDILVVPEFLAVEMCGLYPQVPKVLLVQTHPWLLRQEWRDAVRETGYHAVIATSQLCARMVALADLGQPFLIPLAIDPAAFTAQGDKRDMIAYMPRKRRDEVMLAVEALRRSPALAGYDFVEIDGLAQQQVAEILTQARFFLAFSNREGFGLPPAEAMAAGCIVVGFTGAGGDEYFTEDVAFPVSDSNLPVLCDTVERLALICRDDPAALAEMCQAAHQKIRQNYSRAARDKALLDVFSRIRQGGI